MTDSRDELILRHLDRDTSPAEVAEVGRRFAGDISFRHRFCELVGLISGIREVWETNQKAAAGTPAVLPRAEAMLALKAPKISSAGKPVGERPAPSIDLRQIYFNAVLGAAGGLLGWLVMTVAFAILPLSSLVAKLMPNHFLEVLMKDAIIGLLVGVCIGFAVGSVEGLIASRSWQRLRRGGGIGAILGALGGAVGVPLGEIVLVLVGGGVWARALGWAVFGAFVGTSDGFALKMPTKIRYGILGGTLGGLIGGGTYDVLLRSGSDWGGAIGLIILGACIGALVGLVESLLRKAWLFFLTGRLEGQTRTLDSSRPHTLGSSNTCSIVLPGDKTVSPVHAEIAFEEGGLVVRPRDGKVIVRRDGRDSVVSSCVLRPGDRIHLGETRMIFRKQE